MPRRAYRVAYDGRPYHGFQRQPDVATVEDELLATVRALGVCEAGETPSGWAAAGRTDAGVHALAQTVAFDAPDWCSPRALNGALPGAVRAWASADAPADFHATHDCPSRAYVYHCHAPDADLDRARTVAEAAVGETDLHNLTDDGGDTVRRVHDCTVERDGDFLVLSVRAEGFLHNVVRRLATLTRAVATGAAPESKVAQAFGPDPLAGPEGIPTAPPGPLVLVDAAYPDLTFRVDEAAAESAREALGDRELAARTRGRTLGTVVDGLGGDGHNPL
jgi:tRNA pseudouridine38-40 synthase